MHKKLRILQTKLVTSYTNETGVEYRCLKVKILHSRRRHWQRITPSPLTFTQNVEIIFIASFSFDYRVSALQITVRS